MTVKENREMKTASRRRFTNGSCLQCTWGQSGELGPIHSSNGTHNGLKLMMMVLTQHYYDLPMIPNLPSKLISCR